MLEHMIRWDMLKNGFNPTDKKDIELYWKQRLPQ